MTADRRVVFQLSGVTRTYRVGATEIHALRGVDLELLSGELVVLLGASGSGKSTLVNIMGGLDRPTSGRVRYHDLDLAAASDAELTRYRRRSVGFVFQFYNLVPGLTALENVQLVTELAPDPMPAAEALDRVDIVASYDREVHSPSLDMKIPSVIALSVGTLPAPLAPMVPYIMLSNAILIFAFDAVRKKNYWAAVAVASLLKFAFLFATSSVVIGLLLKQELAMSVSAMMSYPQLLTALLGGVLAFAFIRYQAADGPDRLS